MTPNNIVNMAMVKGLDMIAVTDHNSAENMAAIMERGKHRDILVIPGMEIETAEEVHLICLFPDLERLLAMQDLVYKALPERLNREEIFGPQIILNDKDQEIGRVPHMLITATSLALEKVFSEVSALEGICIPAHLDRGSYSILSNLGAIPEGLPLKAIELSTKCSKTEFLSQHPELEPYPILISSDAHYLWDISERLNFIETDEELKEPADVIKLFNFIRHKVK